MNIHVAKVLLCGSWRLSVNNSKENHTSSFSLTASMSSIDICLGSSTSNMLKTPSNCNNWAARLTYRQDNKVVESCDYTLAIDKPVCYCRAIATREINHLWEKLSCLLLWYYSLVQHSDLNTYILAVAQRSNMLALKQTIDSNITTLSALYMMGWIHFSFASCWLKIYVYRPLITRGLSGVSIPSIFIFK